MCNSLTNKPDPTPYKHVPAGIDLSAKYHWLVHEANRSSRTDFTEFSRIDDFEPNEILGHPALATDAPETQAVRRAIPFRSLTGSK